MPRPDPGPDDVRRAITEIATAYELLAPLFDQLPSSDAVTEENFQDIATRIREFDWDELKGYLEQPSEL